MPEQPIAAKVLPAKRGAEVEPVELDAVGRRGAGLRTVALLFWLNHRIRPGPILDPLSLLGQERSGQVGDGEALDPIGLIPRMILC